MNVVNLLKELVTIPSPSGKEISLGNHLFGLLKKEGFDVKKICLDNQAFNVLATLGTPNVLLSAHMDTVPGELEIKENKKTIYGRGSCDTKGSMAAMICAAIESKESGLNNFGLLFTVGEETDMEGAKCALSCFNKMPFVVVGEPTGLDIVNGHYGILEILIETRGRSVHSSEPEKGVNAIEKLMEALRRIKSIDIYSKSSMNIGVVSGGVAVNIVPDRAIAKVSFRLHPEDESDYYELCTNATTGLARIEKELEVNSVLCKISKEIRFGKKVRTVKYGTELSIFRNGIVLGPGDIRYAHGPEEQVDKEELRQAVKCYEKIVKYFCQSKKHIDNQRTTNKVVHRELI